MIKNVIASCLYFCYVCVIMCTSTYTPLPPYPEIIIKNNKQQQYDLARFEMYKISSRFGCDCQAVTFYNSTGESSNDTIKLISLDIELDTMYFKADSTVYLFSFYAYEGNNMAYIINDKYDNCPQYYGVEYLKDKKVPYRYLIAESSYLDREFISNLSSLDSSFLNCLVNNKKIANKWLLKYLKIE
jgi:predicted nucleic acid-binding Zn finger protein